MPNGFKGRYFPAEFILLCVRWYLEFNVSYCHLAEMLPEPASKSITPLSFAGSSVMHRNWRS